MQVVELLLHDGPDEPHPALTQHHVSTMHLHLLHLGAGTGLGAPLVTIWASSPHLLSAVAQNGHCRTNSEQSQISCLLAAAHFNRVP